MPAIAMPKPNDPTYTEFTDDSENPQTEPQVEYESVLIPDASADESGVMYFVAGDGPHYALLRVSRAKDVAASYYGYCVVACAVDQDGVMILRPGGKAIEREARVAEEKAFLLANPNERANALKAKAIRLALRELALELALETANAALEL